MDVLFLKGSSNAGKTTVMKLLYDTLKKDVHFIEKHYINIEKYTIKHSANISNDFFAHFKKGNKNLILFSLGDYCNDLIFFLNHYKYWENLLIVCAINDNVYNGKDFKEQILKEKLYVRHKGIRQKLKKKHQINHYNKQHITALLRKINHII